MDPQMLKSAHSMLDGIPDDQRRELIAKSRWTCDSHWMMSMVMAAGWEAANRLNLQVGQAVGQVEMQRLMKLLNLKRPADKEQFMTMMTLAMETFITKDYFDYEFKPYDADRNVGIIHTCYAYTKIHSLGMDKEYACGCFGLRAGWYQAMGIKAEEKLLRCLKDGDPRCEILVDNVIFPSS